jgi:hypothetical protein
MSNDYLSTISPTNGRTFTTSGDFLTSGGISPTSNGEIGTRIGQYMDRQESAPRYEQMEPLKSRQIIANRRSAARGKSDFRNKASIVQTSLVQDDMLAIADDVDFGGDPYNSTGQHCIVKAKDFATK